MTTALSPFEFSGATLRGGDYNGEPVLVGKDVCDALGIIKYRDALAQLDDDERVSISVDTPGGRQQMTAVTEGGIWSLAFIALDRQRELARQLDLSIATLRRCAGFTGSSIHPSVTSAPVEDDPVPVP